MLGPDEEGQFWTFYRKTAEALNRKAYRMCRGHSADAEDAHQRTYLRALVHWSTVSGLSDEQRHAWLATTLAREVLQIWREPHRFHEAESYSAAEQPPSMQLEHAGADGVVQAERLHMVCQAIARLEGRPAEVIALHCLGGYEIAEVAQMLGISASTVRVHLHTARQRLRVIMAGEEGPR